MHLAFYNAGQQTGRNLTLPYTHDVATKKVEVNWSLNFTRYKNFDDWVLGAVQATRVLGITDFRYSFPERFDGEISRVRFHFATEGDKLRFACMIHGNTRGDFKRKIFALNHEQANIWFDLIDYYLKENGMKGHVSRLTPERIEITTHCRMDDLAVYQYAQQKRMKLAQPPAILALEYNATPPRPK